MAVTGKDAMPKNNLCLLGCVKINTISDNDRKKTKSKRSDWQKKWKERKKASKHFWTKAGIHWPTVKMRSDAWSGKFVHFLDWALGIFVCLHCTICVELGKNTLCVCMFGIPMSSRLERWTVRAVLTTAFPARHMHANTVYVCVHVHINKLACSEYQYQ